MASIDPELQRLIDAWPTLSPVIRSAVMALVNVNPNAQQTDDEDPSTPP